MTNNVMAATSARGMGENYPADWEQKVRFARDRGLTRVEFYADGMGEPRLCRADLGPAPADKEEDPTQPSDTSPAEEQQRALAERKRIAGAASGGPVKRLGEDS